MTFVRATEFRGQKKKLPWKLEVESFFSSRNLNAPWNSGLWKGWVFASSCSSLPSSVGVSAATPQDSFPLLLDTPPPTGSDSLPQPAHPQALPGFYRLIIPTQTASPRSRILTFFFTDGGGLVMNSQGTHTDMGQGRDTFMNMENEKVWERRGES